jgi:pimeloyl-ACP methyl ester carboxylesterase
MEHITMSTTKVDTLRISGARLHYQVRGTGPILLMMSGGHGDADSFNGMSEHLTDQYTVVAYDRRGYARSPLDNPVEVQHVTTHADDAASLLAIFGHEPAQVFASSAGALIGLDLATRHAHLVSTLVAHEPPALQLLPAAERPQPPEDLIETMRRDGPAAALEGFRALIGATHDDHEPDVDISQQRTPRAAANAQFFFSHEMGMLDRYTPDIAALRAAPTRIIPAGGRSGRDHFPYRCAAALAEQLDVSLVEFPGGHAGYVSHPSAFAEQLRSLLRNLDH